MCYCNPSIRTPKCMACFDYAIHKVQALEEQNKKLMDLLIDQDKFKNPPPIIFCKDCPNINKELLHKV